MVTKNYDNIMEINKKIILFIIMISGLIFVSTYFLNFIIYLWVGKNYDINWTFLLLVAFIVILSIITHVYKTLLNAMSIVYIQVVIYMIGVIICFVLMFVLVKVLKLGVYFFLMSINIGLLLPAIILPITFYWRLSKLIKGGKQN